MLLPLETVLMEKTAQLSAHTAWIIYVAVFILSKTKTLSQSNEGSRSNPPLSLHRKSDSLAFVWRGCSHKDELEHESSREGSSGLCGLLAQKKILLVKIFFITSKSMKAANDNNHFLSFFSFFFFLCNCIQSTHTPFLHTHTWVRHTKKRYLSIINNGSESVCNPAAIHTGYCIKEGGGGG